MTKDPKSIKSSEFPDPDPFTQILKLNISQRLQPQLLVQSSRNPNSLRSTGYHRGSIGVHRKSMGIEV